MSLIRNRYILQELIIQSSWLSLYFLSVYKSTSPLTFYKNLDIFHFFDYF